MLAILIANNRSMLITKLESLWLNLYNYKYDSDSECAVEKVRVTGPQGRLAFHLVVNALWTFVSSSWKGMDPFYQK